MDSGPRGWSSGSMLQPGDSFTVDLGDGRVFRGIVPTKNQPMAATYSDSFEASGTIPSPDSTKNQQVTSVGDVICAMIDDLEAQWDADDASLDVPLVEVRL